MNVFQLNYDTRLQDWYLLRDRVSTLATLDKCVEIDNWWQRAPLVNHHLHLDDIATWPDPWELLVENTYCTVSRALGIYYTLYLTGTESIEIFEGKDHNDDVVLVSVDNAKYILNYHPNTVITNSLSDFKVKRTLSITQLINKIK